MIGQLIAKNNAENQDLCVYYILGALCKDNPLKAIMKDSTLKKDQLLAGLGFLHDIAFSEAMIMFKGQNIQ